MIDIEADRPIAKRQTNVDRSRRVTPRLLVDLADSLDKRVESDSSGSLSIGLIHS